MAVLVALGGFFPPALRAQTPASILLARVDDYDHVSASVVSFHEAGFAVEVDFAAVVPPAATTVSLRIPGGGVLSLERQPYNAFYGEAFFPSAAARNAAYPAGTYRIDVAGGTADSSTQVTLDAATNVAPVRISNFDLFTSAPGDPLNLLLEPIAGYVAPPDFLGLTVIQANGTPWEIQPSSAAGVPTFSQPSPVYQTFEGYYTYLKIKTATANGSATTIATGNGWVVNFSIPRPRPLPTITEQPFPVIAGVGYRATFRVLATSSAPMSYQWKRDGVPVTTGIGADSATLFFPAIRAEDAGVYTVDVTNSGGTTTSAGARLSLAATLKVKLAATALTAVMAIAGDREGNLFIADRYCIRRIDPQGVKTTLAGVEYEEGSVDGIGTAARFGYVRGMVVDEAGQIFMADSDFQTIRKLTKDGVVTTIAGTAGSRGSADGQGAAARFNSPRGLALDAQGNLYVADSLNCTIRKITPAGVVSTLAGRPGQYGSTNGAGSAALFSSPAGIAVAADGTIYVADTSNYLIRKIDPQGVVSTISGRPGVNGHDDGPVAAAMFHAPVSIAIGAGGNLLVADDWEGYIRVISPDGWVTTAVGGGLELEGTGSQVNAISSNMLFVDRAGAVYYSSTLGSRVLRGTWVDGSPLPAFAAQPAGHTVGAGGTVVLSATGSGEHVSYQWKRDGQPIPGGTGSSLVLTNAQAGDAGAYTVDLVSPTTAGVSSQGVNVALASAADAGRLVNLSVRTTAGSQSETFIVGFVIGGASGAGQPLLLRGNGPALANYGVANPLADPVIKLFNVSGGNLMENDNWGGDPLLSAAAARLGAAAVAPGSSRDAALLATLAPGVYSMHVTGHGEAPAIALAEIYDATDGTGTTASSRLMNLSTRAQVGSGDDVLIAGFVIAGSTAKTVLIRGLGPELARLGVQGALADPQLRLFKGAAKVAENGDWAGDAQLAGVARRVGAYTLSSASSKDAALLLTLDPGVYSVHLSGVGESTGVGLIELYDVP